MKKLLLTSSIALCFTSLILAQASNLLVLNRENGSDITGTTIVYWTDTATEIAVEFDTKNASSSSMNVNLKRKEVSVVSGSHNYYCWYDCPANMISPDISATPVQIAAGDTTEGSHLIVHYDPKGNLGMSTIRYTFYDLNNPSDSAFIILVFNGGSMGVPNLLQEKFKMGSLFPNPANNVSSFNYSFANPVATQAIIYDLLGNGIKEFDLTDKEGNLRMNLSDIPSGIYFCSVKSDNKVLATKKLIVNH
jgi:hypothetical protein